jgi:hypothetical protein
MSAAPAANGTRTLHQQQQQQQQNHGRSSPDMFFISDQEGHSLCINDGNKEQRSLSPFRTELHQPFATSRKATDDVEFVQAENGMVLFPL